MQGLSNTNNYTKEHLQENQWLSQQVHQHKNTVGKKYLEAVNIIKKKIDGRIKGRRCDNSSKHKQYFIDGEYI